MDFAIADYQAAALQPWETATTTRTKPERIRLRPRSGALFVPPERMRD